MAATKRKIRKKKPQPVITKAQFLRELLTTQPDLSWAEVRSFVLDAGYNTISYGDLSMARKQLGQPAPRAGKPSPRFSSNGSPLSGNQLLEALSKLSERAGGIERLKKAIEFLDKLKAL